MSITKELNKNETYSDVADAARKVGGEVASEFKSSVNSATKAAYDAGSKFADRAGASAREVYSKVAETGTEKMNSLIGEIRKYPVAATCIGVGIGVVLGLMTQSRRDSR